MDTALGSIEVSVSATGSELDDRFIVRVDGGSPQIIGLAASVRIPDVAPGTHTVLLDEVASNCTVIGDNPRAATVAGGQTTAVAFAVICRAVTGLPAVTGRVAFVSTRDGSPHIYVANAGGSGAVRLASGEAPAWSWDGRRIAFHRWDGEKAHMYIMNADGSNQRFLHEGFNPAWSPDGTIAFNTSLWDPDNPEGGILVMNDDGQDVRLLLRHAWAKDYNWAPGYGVDAVSYPNWSPDGEHIAFWLYAGYAGTHSIGVMNADGSEPRDLQADQWTQYSTRGRPAWSPDGSRIVVGRGFSIAIHLVASGRQESVLADGMLPNNPDWSPDGQHIVFERSFYGVDRRRIYIATLETGAIRQLIPEAESARLADYEDYSPAWSRVRE